MLQAPSSLHRAGIAREIRRELLQGDLIEAVALVPAGGDRHDRAPLAIWVLRPFGETGNGTVLLVDAVGTSGDVASAVQQFRAAPDAFDTQPGFAVSVAVAQILKTDEADLLPSRWLALSGPAPDLEEAQQALAAARDELAALRHPPIRLVSQPAVTDRRRIRALIRDGSITLVRGIALSPGRPGERDESAPRHDLRAHPILDAWSFDGPDHQHPLDSPPLEASPERLTRTGDVAVAAAAGAPRARRTQGGPHPDRPDPAAAHHQAGHHATPLGGADQRPPHGPRRDRSRRRASRHPRHRAATARRRRPGRTGLDATRARRLPAGRPARRRHRRPGTRRATGDSAVDRLKRSRCTR